MNKLIYLLALTSLFVAVICCAPLSAASGAKVYICPKVTEPPVIDGKLDDAAWAKAPAITLVHSGNGKPVQKTTIARMCWDDTNLYISFNCVDEDIWGTLTAHDAAIYNEEVVEAFLCPSNNLNEYFEFNVSPRNVVFDGILRNVFDYHSGPGSDIGWNCKDLRTAVLIDGTLDNREDKDRGFNAEISIPFAGIGWHAPKPGERWRGNLYRIDLSPKPAEFQSWCPTFVKPAAFHVPEKFGTIFFSR